MSVAQCIIFMDTAGNVRCELPGMNGHRQQVRLIPGDEFWCIKEALQGKLLEYAERAEAHARAGAEYSRERAERIFADALRKHGRELAELAVPSERRVRGTPAQLVSKQSAEELGL
jgi:hypothetical protein